MKRKTLHFTLSQYEGRDDFAKYNKTGLKKKTPRKNTIRKGLASKTSNLGSPVRVYLKRVHGVLGPCYGYEKLYMIMFYTYFNSFKSDVWRFYRV